MVTLPPLPPKQTATPGFYNIFLSMISDTYKSSFMSVDHNLKQWWAKLIEKSIYSRPLPETPATFTL